MTPERVAFGQPWVVEIIGRVARHAEALHDGDRSRVRWYGERHDLIESHVVEAECQRSACRFSRITEAPVCASESPADLHARGEMGGESRNGKTDVTNEWRNTRHLDGPEAEAALLELSADACGERIALGAIQERRHVRHHFGVCIQLGERLEVLVTPTAKRETISAKLVGQGVCR